MNVLSILKAYINKEKLNIDLTDDDLKLLKEQSLQTLLYPVTHNKLYKKYYISWVSKQELFFNLQEEITYLFNTNNINHIYFKGAVLAKLFDDSSVRTRGDIDLYVSPNELTKAKQLLVDNGFLLDSVIEDNTHHIGLKKNNIEVELHFNMLDPDCDKSWNKLFNNPFELSKNIDSSLYEFTHTYHLIYCIMHFAHHLRHGAGIRYLMDFYYMFKKTNIEIELLHSKISECKLNRLYSNIINALRNIFEVDFDSSISNEDVTFFINYLLSYGIHGHTNNETAFESSVHHNKIKFFFSRVFLTNKPYRTARYPKLGAHWYLYPVCLIWHWIYLLTHKLKAGIRFLFGKNKNKDLYKQLGI